MKKGSRHTPEAIDKIRKNNWMRKGLYKPTDAHKKALSEANKGQIPWIKGKKQSAEHIRNRVEARRKNGRPWQPSRGKLHYRWRDDRTALDELHRLRSTKEYALWRNAVFERDRFTCVFCGASGVYLNADHIKPFAYFPELRFAIDNGRTLCVPCHKKTDTYGGRAVKYKNSNR